MKRLILFLLLATASLGWSQTLINGSRVITGTWNYCADAGASDAYACSLSPAITAYTTGGRYTFKAATANTGGATLALNGLTATAIVKYVGGVAQALEDNDIRAGAIVEVLYDGTNFQVVSLLGNAAPAYTLPTASAGTIGGIRIGSGLSIDGSGIVTASGAAVACDPSNIEHFCIVEEFFGGSSSTSALGTHGWKWVTISSGTTSNISVGSSGGNITQHPGLVYIQSTAVANSGGLLLAANPTTSAIVNLADLMAEDWEISWIFKLDSITDVRVRLGLSEEAAALVPNTNSASIQLRYDTDAAFGDGSKNTTGSWVAQICGYGGATTCADAAGVYAVMNVTPDTNWTMAKIKRVGTTFSFTINTTTKTMCASGCDMTTPSPSSASGDALAPVASFGISSTTQRKILLDRMAFGMTGLTRY